MSYNPETGIVTEWKVKPYNKVDEIAAYHDICYDMGKNKGDCDREMIQSLDNIPYGEMPKWGQTARFLINTKQKLYTPNWTEEVFVIDEVLNTKPFTYKIVDLMGEAIEGSFYEQELQKQPKKSLE